MTDIVISAMPISPATINIKIESGVGFIMLFNMKNTDLTGYKIYMQARETYDDLAIPQFNCTTDNGKISFQVSTVLNQITNQNEPLTTIKIEVSSQETFLLSQYKKLLYDIFLIPPTTPPFKLFEGKILIDNSVTRFNSSGVLQP